MKINSIIICYSLFLGRLISHYPNESSEGNFHYQSNVCESIHMINPDEDKFFHGFIPIWALALFGIAILFAVIFLAGLICHLSGCRKTQDNQTNQLRLSIVHQPLLVEKIKSIKSEQLTEKSTDHSF